MKILKKHLRFMPLFMLFTLMGMSVRAQTVYDWIGTSGTSSNWNDVKNWQSTTGGVTTSPATSYPGQLSSSDIADFGVNITMHQKNQPVLPATLGTVTIAALNMGDNLIPSANVTYSANNAWSIVLTINGNLIITGTFLQKHSTTGTANSGNVSSFYTRPIFNYLAGSGSVTCSNFTIGDYTNQPAANNVINVTGFKIGGQSGGSTLTVTVTGNVTSNSTGTKDVNNNILSESFAELSFAAGTLNVYGQIVLRDIPAPFTPPTGNYNPLAWFTLDLFSTTSDTPVLNLYNAAPDSIQTGANLRNELDFYNVNGTTASTYAKGSGTVNFAATSGTQDVPIYKGTTNTSPYFFIDHQYTLTNTITTLGSITGGSGYVDGIYTNVPLTGGTGGGAIANITVSGGVVTAVNLISGFSGGYTVGDVLSASNTNLGGSGSGFSIPVSAISASTTFQGIYPNITFSGGGTKSVTPTTGAFSVMGNFSVASSGVTVDVGTNNPTLSIARNFTSVAGSTVLKTNTAASTLTIGGTTTNGGTFTQSGSVANTVTFTGIFNNTGTYNQSGTGAVIANNITNNSGTYTQSGSGAATFNKAFNSTSPGIYSITGAGLFTAASTTANGGIFNQSGTNLATFTGAVTNTGTINQTNTGNILFSAAFNNSGSGSALSQTGGSTINFASTASNDGTITQNNASGIFNFNNTFANTLSGSKFTLTNGTTNFLNSYTNSGTFVQTGGTVNINQTGTNQSLVDNSIGGTTFSNVNVENGSSGVTMSGSGQFYVSDLGVLTMSNSTPLAANGLLTVSSDINGTGTIAKIPSGCSITGNVTVQRYIPGGSSTSRGYRLLSSAVNAGSDGFGNKIYSINYLLNSTYISGTGFPTATYANGGSKTGNPSLYLYRENLAPLYTTFLNSNYIGIADITTNPPTYGMNDATYPTANIPVGNGYLFYFRGGSTTATPFVSGSVAQPAVLASSGALNQGNINFADWYTPNTTTLGRTTASGDPTIEGFNLVGNPYPSSIDWDKADSVSSSAAIYTPHVGPYIYMLIPGGSAGSGNYGIYGRGTGYSTNRATHIVGSGVGFFVIAGTAGTPTLQFTEAAKTTTQPASGSLFLAKLPATGKTAQILDLQMKLDSINSDEMIISFDTNAKASYNMMEDARYKTGSGKVSLSSLSSDKIPLAINQLPLALKGDTIKLKVGATASGNYTLNLKSITGVPTLYGVWLKDAFTKDSVNLRTTASYSFAINTADTTTFGSNRFTLMLIQDPALAYKLLSFAATKAGPDNKQVQLTWTTQNEQNTTHFTVERSNDNGKTFDAIGNLLSSGTGSYSLLDKNPLKGDNQYRLKQVDLNNAVTYSAVADVQFNGNNNIAGHLNLYPNPAFNNIHLSFDPKGQENTTYNVKVTNSAGMVVRYAVITEPNWQANISNLLTGTYLILVTDKKDNSVVGQTKFVKL